MKKYMLIFLCVLLNAFNLQAQQDEYQKDSLKNTVYQFDIKEEIGSAIWQKMRKALSEAKESNADYFLICMNTYGGELIIADSMRTALLRCPIPTVVFINNNAASAGALISLACDSIYMTEGASIGAATVVNGVDGKEMPDKYQSYMRSMMRSTAESHGADTLIEAGQQKIKWFRDPRIAEAMVDERIVIPNVIDSGKTLTFTTREALRNHFCEGKANSVSEVLERIGERDATVVAYKADFVQKVIGILVNPFLQSILLMIIMGGIWFELQSPGVGFPLLAAGIAVILYFAPLLLEGIATYWELALFAIGILLLVLEFFVIPGFGVAGVLGFVFSITGLVLALVGTLDFEINPASTYRILSLALFQVFASILLLIIMGFIFGGIFFRVQFFNRIALTKSMTVEDGFVVQNDSLKKFLNKDGIVVNDLHPSGTIEIDGECFDAVAISGFIDKGETITVRKMSMGQFYVEVKG